MAAIVRQVWQADQARWAVVLLGLMACSLFLVKLDVPLLEPEEARYAEIPRQMLEQGEFLTPVLHGEIYLHKPPLLYWLVMASYQVFGVHDWSGRLVASIAGILIVLTTFLWARRTLGLSTAVTAGIVLCLAPRFAYQTRMLSLDGLLALCVIASWALANAALMPVSNTAGSNTEDATRFHWRYWLLATLMCGLGVMTKGPVAIVLVAVPIAGMQWLRRLRIPFAAWVVFGAGSVGLAAPWFVYLFWKHPQAAHDFFWLHNVRRFVDPIDHEEPFWFFLPHLLLGTLPWSLWLGPCLWQLIRNDHRDKKRMVGSTTFAWLCLGWTVIFFSASGCKRPGYILPAFAPLAIVLGHYLSVRFGILKFEAGRGEGEATRRTGIRLMPSNRRQLCWMFAAVYTIMIVVFHQGLPIYHQRFGIRDEVEEQASRGREKNLQVICYPRRWDSVPFYLRRSDVAVFREDQQQALVEQLRKGPALVFVKQRAHVEAFEKALPPDLEWLRLGDRDDRVLAGMVRNNELITQIPTPRQAVNVVSGGVAASR